MVPRSLIALFALVVLGGCAGTADVRPLLQDFDRYDADFQARKTNPEAVPSLKAGREKRGEAGALLDAGKKKEALPLAEKALADAGLALEMDRMDAADRRADACRLEEAQARQKWEEALFLLEQTEGFAGRKALVAREAPPAPVAYRPLPASTLAEDGTPEVSSLQESWRLWKLAAGERGIAVADLQNVFQPHVDAAQAEKAAAPEAEHAGYIARRAVQALECRVRAFDQETACARSAVMVADLGDARADALRATLDLERGMQDGLRRELNQLRAEAKSRQDELFDALSQMEGKFASIHQEARGTIVSLADILFDFNKATLRRDVEFNLVKIATILNQFGEMGVLIEGHTDSIGTEEYNLELSRRRAQAVHDFLISQDVKEERLTWEGYGESRPVAENETDEGRQRNRRVDLVIQDAP